MSPRHAHAARLRERLGSRMSRSAYPVADWRIVERGFEPEYLPAAESVFAVANGYLGVRGTPEEGTPSHDAGVTLNGLHETWPIVYPEDAYGLARTGQTIVNATDGSIIRLLVDDEPFDLAPHDRPLRARARHADRRAAPRGRVRDARAAQRDLLAAPARSQHRHLAAMDYEVVALDAGPHRDLVRARHARARGRRPTTRAAARASRARCSRRSAPTRSGRRAVLRLATRQQRLELACGMEHVVEADVRRHVARRMPRATARRSSCSPTSRPAGRAPDQARATLGPGQAGRRPRGPAGRTLDRAQRDGYDVIEVAQPRARRGLLAAQRRARSTAPRGSSRRSASTSSS